MGRQKPVLYYDELSPQARSCLMLIKMLDADVSLRYVDLFSKERIGPENVKRKFVQAIPTLVHNSLIITDSQTILTYICDNFVGPGSEQLFPQCEKMRTLILNRFLFESAVLMRRHAEFLSEIVTKPLSEINMAEHEKKIFDAYDMLESYMEKSKFLAGDTLTIADISIITTVEALDLTFPVMNNRYEWPKLASWLRRMRALPEYKNHFDETVASFGSDKFRHSPSYLQSLHMEQIEERREETSQAVKSKPVKVKRKVKPDKPVKASVTWAELPSMKDCKSKLSVKKPTILKSSIATLSDEPSSLQHSTTTSRVTLGDIPNKLPAKTKLVRTKLPIKKEFDNSPKLMDPIPDPFWAILDQKTAKEV